MKLHMRKTGKFYFSLLIAAGLGFGLLMLHSFHQTPDAYAQTAGDEQETAPENNTADDTGGEPSASEDKKNANLGSSGLPIPRFVSLKPARVNIRVGPGRDYAVSWLYTKSGLPVEIIQEYDNWRRIRDADGTEGWVYQAMLAGKRTAIISPWQRGKPDAFISLYASASDTARVIARAEPGVIATIRKCDGQWCQLDSQGTRGWIQQSQIWGAYPGEEFD